MPAFLHSSSSFLPGSRSLTLPPAASAAQTMRVLVLDVDDAELVAVLGIEHVLVADRRGRDHLRIVDADLARIDVADAVGIFHRRQQIAGILELAVVDRQHGAGVVHLEHVERRKALHVGGAARQPLLGEHLRAPLGIAGLVLHHLPAVLDQDRLLDVLVEQAGVVAAPGADDDAALGLRRRRARQAGGAGQRCGAEQDFTAGFRSGHGRCLRALMIGREIMIEIRGLSICSSRYGPVLRSPAAAVPAGSGSAR